MACGTSRALCVWGGVLVAGASYELEDVVDQGDERGERGYEVGVGGPFEGVDGAVASLTGGYYAAFGQPVYGTLAGVDFDPECDEGE